MERGTGFPVLRQWLHRRRKPLRYALLPQLLANERLDPAELHRRQQAAIDRMVRFAAEHTDHYAEAFAGRISEAGQVKLSDLPVLTREQVMSRREMLRNRTLQPGQYRMGHTGGSTGTPLAYYYDDEKIERMRAGMMRGYMWSGWRPGEKILNFWGARQDLKKGGGRRWREFIAAERTLGAWEFDERTLDRWARMIRDWRPVLLQGYASVLAELADHLLRRRLPLPRGLKGVYSTAEVLHDWQRQRMESAFACPVFNQYGSREVPNMALECRHGNLHLFTDLVALESLEEGGQHHLLVTSLTDRVMPFIRYRNGDTGRLLEESCSCGSPFPLMTMDLCRSNDLVRTPAGRVVYPSWFVHLLDGVEAVRRYRFVQERPERLVLYWSGDPLPEETGRGLQRRVKEELGMELELQQVERLERSASGKHRFVVGLPGSGKRGLSPQASIRL